MHNKNEINRKWISGLLSVLSIFLVSSCSNPKQEAFEFVTANGKIGNANLFDSSNVIMKNLIEWKKKYVVQSYKSAAGAGLNVQLSDKISIEFNYELTNHIITGIEVHPNFQGDNSRKQVTGFYELIRSYIRKDFINAGGNVFTKTTDKSIILSIPGEDNLAFNSLRYYSDFNSIIANASMNFYKKMQGYHIAKTKVFDYKDGIVKSPPDKIWFLKTKELVSTAFVDSTKENSSTVSKCDYITIGDRLVLPDIIINGHCLKLKGIITGANGGFKNFGGGMEPVYSDKNIYEITKLYDFDYQILPPNTSLCIPAPEGYAIELIEVEEYNLNEYIELQTSLKLLKKIGFQGDELQMIRLLNGKFSL